MRLETVLQLICVGLIVFASLMIATDSSNSGKTVTVTQSVDAE